MFKGLDFVTSEARRYGVRLILSFVNNYKDLGGRPQFVQWARNQGQSLNSDDDFYTNHVVRGYYKNHVRSLLFLAFPTARKAGQPIKERVREERWIQAC
ncbi:hypothetical protein AMTR_s00103p00014500 [Amborella trichopoda]|uniref:Uncharacterized protein n=1 Tax=Amborella trichopoda TaxID=13333 RepID=W1P1H2_AMBTC|nr:hypothetical protein AMTR_s00103p00014500 [Amborella trichopoda]